MSKKEDEKAGLADYLQFLCFIILGIVFIWVIVAIWQNINYGDKVDQEVKYANVAKYDTIGYVYKLTPNKLAIAGIKWSGSKESMREYNKTYFIINRPIYVLANTELTNKQGDLSLNNAYYQHKSDGDRDLYLKQTDVDLKQIKLRLSKIDNINTINNQSKVKNNLLLKSRLIPGINQPVINLKQNWRKWYMPSLDKDCDFKADTIAAMFNSDQGQFTFKRPIYVTRTQFKVTKFETNLTQLAKKHDVYIMINDPNWEQMDRY